jgi:FOG: WD40 repeat
VKCDDPDEKEKLFMEHYKIMEGYIEDIAFTDDAQSMITGSNDGIVRIINVSDGTVQREINHGIVIYSVTLQSQGDLAVFGDEYGTVSILNRKSGQLLSNIALHSNVVSSLSLNRSGELILSSSWDGMVQLWEIDSENSIVLSDSDDEYHFARFSQDGTLVAFAGDKGIYHVMGC